MVICVLNLPETVSGDPLSEQIDLNEPANLL